MFYGLMSAADACDRWVQLANGMYVGRIEDVMLDRSTGQAVAAVLRVPPTAPAAGGLYVVPWEQFYPTFGLAAFVFRGRWDDLVQATYLASPPSAEAMRRIHRLPEGVGQLSRDRATTRPHF